MKRYSFLVLLVLTASFCEAQSVEKVITEDNVSRINKTLSADAMMGRPAAIPERIEPAIAFIESEFKNIGLKPMKGLSSFRQEFTKDRISTAYLNVVLNGKSVNKEEVLVISDKTDINLVNKLPLRTVMIDSTVTNKSQFLRSKIIEFLRDTTSGIMLVDREATPFFNQLHAHYKSRFVSNTKYVKVFALGDADVVTSHQVEVKQKIETIRMTNVIGVLEGKKKPDEMVLFSAHYDHIGILQPVEGDSIANGADDDASGTTAVIELARYFKKANDNNRTLVFVAFTAEEIGGFGSRYFSEQLNPDKVIAMFNIEMIGKPSKWGANTAFMTGYERSDFGEILNRNLASTPYSIKPDPYTEQNLFYRSDNATLARLGVPAHSISTDQIDSDELYHSVNDEFESIDIKNMTAVIRAIALSAKSIVAGTDTPTRIDKATVN